MKEQFKASLEETPWDSVFIFDDLDDMVESWETLFNQALDSHCPWSEKRDTQPPWMNACLLKQMHNRDSCLKTARLTNTTEAWERFRKERNKVVSMVRDAKRLYYNEAFNNANGDSRIIWKTI